MILVTTEVTPGVVLPNPPVSTDLGTARPVIEAIFAHPSQPLFTEVESIRYSTDGIRGAVSAPKDWRCGNYVTLSEYSSATKGSVPVYYNVSGTGPNGEYIPPHSVDHNGNILPGNNAPRDFRVYEEQKMIKLLDLKLVGSDEEGRQYYRREGFEGRYYLQHEELRGEITVHYTGGAHASGVRLPPQTFVNGSWDLKRTKRYGESQEPGTLALTLPSRRRIPG